MNEKEFLDSIGISKSGSFGDDGSYIIDLSNSDEYGRMFTILDKSDDLDIMQDNQVITEQGSSLMYEALNEPYSINLLADFDNDLYQLVITKIK